MARQCVGIGRFATADGIPRKRGFKVESDLVCGKQRGYIYLGKKGNTGTYGAKYGKGGCKFGFHYKYKNKAGKMRTGCKRKGLKLRISALKTHVPTAVIPTYAVKPRGPRKRTMDRTSIWQTFHCLRAAHMPA